MHSIYISRSFHAYMLHGLPYTQIIVLFTTPLTRSVGRSFFFARNRHARARGASDSPCQANFFHPRLCAGVPRPTHPPTGFRGLVENSLGTVDSSAVVSCVPFGLKVRSIRTNEVYWKVPI